MKKYLPSIDIYILQRLGGLRRYRRGFSMMKRPYMFIRWIKEYEYDWDEGHNETILTRFVSWRNYTYSPFYRRHKIDLFLNWECECSDYCKKRTKSDKDRFSALLSRPVPNLIKNMTREIPARSGTVLRWTRYKKDDLPRNIR